MSDLFPVLIFSTRHASEEQRGEWIAFAKADREVPEAEGPEGQRFFGYQPLDGSWWEKHREKAGVGHSPNEAYEDLLRKRGLLEQ